MKTRLTSPQILRGLAAIWVAVFHGNELSQATFGQSIDSGLVSAGHLGVEFFFVLSGFIIYFIHEQDAGNPSSVKIYFLKRLARIYPLVFIVTTIKVAYMVLSSHGVPAGKYNLSSIVGSYLLLPGTDPWINDVTWTLSYEMWFYLVFGVLLILGKRILGVFGAAYTVCIIGLHLPFCQELTGLAKFVFSPWVVYFIIGAVVAFFYARRTELPKRSLAGLAAFSVALILCGVLFRWDHLPGGERQIYWGVAFSVLLFSCLHLEKHLPTAYLRPLLFAGDASYSIYLFHGMPLDFGTLVLRGHLAGSSPMVIGIAMTAITAMAIGGGMLFYLAAEAPIQSFFRRKLSNRASIDPLPRAVPNLAAL